MSDLKRRWLFIDMDGTIAEWKPSESVAFEDLYEQGYFLNLLAYEPVVQAITLLMKVHPDVEIHILSSYLTDSAYALSEKNEWLDRHLNISEVYRHFCPSTKSKPEFIKEIYGSIAENDFLLDDYSVNLHDWKDAGGTGIKLMNGVNGTVGTWKGATVSRFDEAEQIMQNIYDTICAVPVRKTRKSTMKKGCCYCEAMRLNRCPDAFSEKSQYCGSFDLSEMP